MSGSGPPSQRLFWRVYLHGLILLLLMAIAVGVTGHYLGRGSQRRGYAQRLSRDLSVHAAELFTKPERFESDLKRERELLGLDMSLYRVDGRLLATNVKPPVPPLPSWEVARIGERGASPIRGRHWGVAAPVIRNGRMVAYAVSGPLSWAGPIYTRVAVAFVAVLVVLALGSLPLARALTRPLETLTRTAQRLGSGDLSVRTGIRRDDEVGRLAAAFDEMANRLEELVRGEKELLANVSHELRTPLARIRVALEIAAEGDPQRAQRYLAEIGTDLAELERLIGDVMTLARLDLGAGPGGIPPLRRAPVDPAEIVRAAAERFRSAFPERSLALSVAEDLPRVDADATMLRRVLDNLLDNARKYSGGEAPIALELRSGGGEVEFEVRDRGIGLEPADLAQLFTPFFRTDRSRARGTGGVGLGLALARRIVEAHGGRIDVESRPGEGATFRFVIPAIEGR